MLNQVEEQKTRNEHYQKTKAKQQQQHNSNNPSGEKSKKSRETNVTAHAIVVTVGGE